MFKLIWLMLTSYKEYKKERKVLSWLPTDNKQALEAVVVKLILEDFIKFKKCYINKYAKEGYVSTGGMFKLYNEDSGYNIFPYFTIDGVDTELNHIRIKTAIEKKIDIGYNTRYSWI
jgi:hypothetical protein